MTALLVSLVPYLVAAGSALLVIWKFWAEGKRKGVEDQQVKEAIQRAEDIKRAQDANDAGARVRPDDPGVSVDPHNRDTWPKGKA